MTVANNYTPIVTAANGSTTVFSGSWNAISAAYLVVQLLNTTTGVFTPVTQGAGSTQYQVTSLTSSGFVITFNTAPATGNNVIISRSTTPQQTVPYTTSRGFQGSVEEGSFDAITAMVQELNDLVTNSIQVPVGDTIESLILPIATLRANYVLAFDASGNVVVSTQTLAQIQNSIAVSAASATAAAASATAASGSQTAAAGSATASAASATQAALNASNAPVYNCPTVSGTNTITLTTSASVTSYADGQIFEFLPAVTNTGATVANVNTLGNITVLDEAGNALVGGEFVAGVGAGIMKKASNFYLVTNARNFKNGNALQASSLNGGSLTGLRNPLLNACFRVWQRGLSVSVASTAVTYTADRWAFWQSSGTVAATVAQQTNPATGVFASARVQRNSGNTNTGLIQYGQAIESRDIARFQGQPITISFFAKCGANYSATSNQIIAQVQTGTGTDEGTSSFLNSSWAGLSTIANATFNLTTTRTKYTLAGTVGSSIGELGFRFLFTPTGTAGTNDWFEVDSIQIETGTIATPFEPRPVSLETDLCRRHFEGGTNGFHGDVSNGGTYGPYIQFATQKRAAPTIGWGTVTVDIGSFDTSAPTVATRFSTNVNSFQAVKSCTAASGDRGWWAPWTASADL